MTIFENIKKARIQSGLSQKSLAKKLGISDKTISAYETGRAIPPMPTLTEISKITGVSISQIIEESKEERESKTYNEKKLAQLEERISNLEQIIVKLFKKLLL